ncbi:carbohydrate esterase family 4 protein [Mycena vulgaris]|nr:carbohydrate esterase family 4 protein [Mycena vulgaris]
MLGKTSTILLSALLVTAGPVIDRAAPKAVVYESCIVNNTVAITFDDGPYLYMTEISDLLTANQARATFFVNGDNYDCIYNPDVVQRLQYTYEAGHQIASHTWSHPNLKALNADQITAEIVRLDTAFDKILGIHTDFLRPPYGNYNTLVRQTAYTLNKKLITWDFDSGDSVNATWQQSEADYNATVAQHPQTLLALNHETEVNTAHIVVAYVIAQFQNAGYNLVTVAECLGQDMYASVGSFGTRDSTWVCPTGK